MSYTVVFQVLEDTSSTPLLSKEAAVNGDTALKLYSQVLHETVGAGIIPKTLSEIISAPSVYSDPEHPEELQQQSSGVENLCKLFGEECETEQEDDDDPEGYAELAEAVQQVRQEECQAATPKESALVAGFVCDSCGSAITEKQAEESYVISGKELCSSCFHQHCVAAGLREPELKPAPDTEPPAPVVEQKEWTDSTGKTLRKWTDTEKALLTKYPDVKSALAGYREAYLDSDRSDQSVNGAWYGLKKEGRIHCFKHNQYVQIIDSNSPLYKEAGKILEIKATEALVSFKTSTCWCAFNHLKLQESPSKN